MNSSTAFSIRAPTPADAGAIVELINAASVSEGGSPDMTKAIIRADWAKARFDLAHDAWLAVAPGGQVLGYETLFFEPSAGKAEVDGYVHPAHKWQGIGTQLLRLAEARARSNLAIHTLHGAIEATNQAAQQLFGAEGYHTVRHFWRMEIELAAPPPAPELPAGLALRAFELGHDERATHATIQEAFRDHWGSSPIPFEEWRDASIERDDFDPSLWFLALDGDEVAGAVLAFRRTETLGWVRNLSVRRPWRGRGLGMALLRQAFVACYACGRRTIGLGVDAQNPTGATHLYERAGMHIAERYNMLEKGLKETK